MQYCSVFSYVSVPSSIYWCGLECCIVVSLYISSTCYIICTCNQLNYYGKIVFLTAFGLLRKINKYMMESKTWLWHEMTISYEVVLVQGFSEATCQVKNYPVKWYTQPSILALYHAYFSGI